MPVMELGVSYCPEEGYADSGVRYNWGLGRIIITTTHDECSTRCTQYSGSQYQGGCKGYMTGMYAGMLFCRSYGGNVRSTPCAWWAHPSSSGLFSGALGQTYPSTGQKNIGGNCCSNITFVKITEGGAL